MTRWQAAVSAAAFKIALKLPKKLMYDRASLKTSAEAEARKTFVYHKKTGSRSKFSDSEKPAAKRKEQSTDDRSDPINFLLIQKLLPALSCQVHSEIRLQIRGPVLHELVQSLECTNSCFSMHSIFSPISYCFLWPFPK